MNNAEKTKIEPSPKFAEAKEEFISEWGVIGSAWGINRTMAQIHALLMTSTEPLCTDDIMANLEISRGNAHGNLKELVNWGIVKSVIKKGDRKEYFQSEHDVWKMFCTIIRERMRREIQPAVEVLQDCAEKTADLPSDEAQSFNKQMVELHELLGVASAGMDKISSSADSKVARLILKSLK